MTIKSWRPDNWPKCPCDGCKEKQVDEYGLLCDLSCGKATAYANYQWGIESVISWIRGHDLIKPDGNSLTRFEPFYQIEERELGNEVESDIEL